VCEKTQRGAALLTVMFIALIAAIVLKSLITLSDALPRYHRASLEQATLKASLPGIVRQIRLKDNTHCEQPIISLSTLLSPKAPAWQQACRGEFAQIAYQYQISNTPIACADDHGQTQQVYQVLIRSVRQKRLALAFIAKPSAKLSCSDPVILQRHQKSLLIV
jgi:hypothetical protein